MLFSKSKVRKIIELSKFFDMLYSSFFPKPSMTPLQERYIICFLIQIFNQCSAWYLAGVKKRLFSS